MGINTRLEAATAQTTDGLDITFTANAPTPSSTQTVADGDAPTVAETGQFIADTEAQFAKITADLAALYAVVNAGE